MDKKIQVVLFDEEELTKTLIESYLKEVTFPYNVLKFNQFDEALIPETDEKKIIIVSINKTNSSILSLITKLSQNRNNLFLIVSYDKSSDLQVKALRTGAKDFLFKPLVQSDFIDSIKIIYKNEIMVNTSNSKVYNILSLEESVGKTFFAFNMAKELADVSNEKVLLIDFNDSLNDLGSTLSITINFNTPYFVNRVTEQNAVEMFSKIARYKKSSLYIMGNGMFRNEEKTIDLKKVSGFFDIAKKHFKYIFVDSDSNQQDLSGEVAAKTNINFVVMSPSLTVAEKLKPMMDKLLSNKPCRVVLNKYNSKKEEGLLAQIEQTLGKQLFLKIPKNIMATSAALNKGSSIKEVSPDLDIVKTYVQLAKYIQNKD